MSNRYGLEHKALPYCLRQLPENQPRNRQEYLIRKRLIPEDPDNYFDNRGHFLYDSKCMGEELERLKQMRRASFGLVKKQTGVLKSLILKEKAKPPVDIASMRERFNRAQAQHTKDVAKERRRNSMKKSCFINSVNEEGTNFTL